MARTKADRGIPELSQDELAQRVAKGSAEAQLEQLKRRKLELLEAQRLYKQSHALEFFTPQPQQQPIFDALQNPDKRIIAVFGGNRCLAGSEEIYDPVEDVSRRLDKIREPFHVVAWDGSRLVTARAGVPFTKGQGSLVRVHLSTGQSVLCTGSHRVLQPDGFRSVSDLPQGAAVFLPQSISDICPSVHVSDDQSFWKTVQDFLFDCLVYHRLCGEQLLPVRGIDLDELPSPVDVLTRIDPSVFPSSELQGDSARRPRNSHSCPRFARPSTLDVLRLLLGRCADILSRVSCKPCKSTLGLPLAVRLSRHVSYLQQSIAEFVQRAKCNPSRFSWVEPYDSPYGGNCCGHVSRIEEIGADVKWDFEVEGYGNYLHAGIIHHNSGKSASLVASAVSLGLGRYPWVPKPPIDLPKPQSISLTPNGLLVDGQLYADEKHYKAWRAAQLVDKGKLRFDGPLKIRILGEDYSKAIGQTILPKFFEFMPPEMIAAKRKGQTGVYDQVVLTTGTVYDFLTYAQESSMMEGWDGHVALYDEPPPRPIFIANQRGLVDHAGVSFFAMTPLKEPWIANEIANNPAPHIITFELDSTANPHIDKKSLDEFFQLLSPEELETRSKGKFLHLQGLVFKEFKKSTHVIKEFVKPAHWTHYVAIDTHPRTQQALLFVAIDDRNRTHVVHEIFKHGTPEQVADWITEYHGSIHPIYTAIIEPSSQGDSNRGDTTYQIIERKLSAANIPLQLGSKDLAGGILQVREALQSANGQPSLFVVESCQTLINEFMNYIWEDWGKATDRNEKQKPRDKDDHLIECLRRLIQFPARYVDSYQLNSLVSQANKGYRPRDRLTGY